MAGVPRLSINVHISSEGENAQRIPGLRMNWRLCRDGKQMVINCRASLGGRKKMYIKLLQRQA